MLDEKIPELSHETSYKSLSEIFEDALHKDQCTRHVFAHDVRGITAAILTLAFEVRRIADQNVSTQPTEHGG